MTADDGKAAIGGSIGGTRGTGGPDAIPQFGAASRGQGAGGWPAASARSG